MKKFTSTGLGGAPIYKSDLKEVFNDEIWAAMQAILSPFDSDTEGIIVSGCVTTANASNFDMTAGIVYLNGEFMRIAAVTNQTFTKYIAPSTAVNDTRSFEDASSQVVAVTKGAELVGGIPGGQYIAITSLTDPDDRRWKPVISDSVSVRTKVIEIANWDMDTDSSKFVNHGLTDDNILDVSVIIQDNVIGKFRNLIAAGTSIAGYFVINTSQIEMYRVAAGDFDSAGYVNTPIKITITYKA